MKARKATSKSGAPAVAMRRLVGRIRRLAKQMNGQIMFHREQSTMLQKRRAHGDRRDAREEDSIADSLLHFVKKLEAVAPNDERSDAKRSEP